MSFPPEWGGERTEEMFQFVRDLCAIFPYQSGHASFCFLCSQYEKKKSQNYAWAKSMRHRGIDIFAHPNDKMAVGHDAIKGADWLTLLCDTFAERLGGESKIRQALSEAVEVLKVPTGLLLQAGPRPRLGDTNRRDFLPEYKEVYRVVVPWPNPASIGDPPCWPVTPTVTRKTRSPGDAGLPMVKGFPLLIVPAIESLSGEIELIFECKEQPNVPIGEIDRLVRAFIRVGEVGGFPTRPTPVDRSRLGLASGLRPSGVSVAFDLQAANVTPYAFQVLRNMVGWSEASRGRINRIVIREKHRLDQPRATVSFPGDVDEEDVYPPPSSRITFEILWENTQFSMSRRCLVEMARSLEPADVLAVADRLQIWYDLLDAGGFVLPSDFPEVAESSSGRVSQFDEYSIEIAVFRFQASEMAWVVLANLLDSLSRGSLKVVRMTVE